MDLAAVKDAPACVLVRGSIAAARNACCLVEDAELLSGAGRLGRAYSLAGLAVEEVGKSASLTILVAMPENVRARAPLGRMLEWHQMKLVAGYLVAAVPGGPPGGPPELGCGIATMGLTEVAGILDDAQVCAREADRLKQRGLYVDVDWSGEVREPSEVRAAEVRGQLDRARRAASTTEVLLGPDAPAWIAAPEEAVVEFSCALVSAFAGARFARTPEAAGDVLLNAASKLQG